MHTEKHCIREGVFDTTDGTYWWWQGMSTIERRQQLEGAGATQIDLELLALSEKLNEK